MKTCLLTTPLAAWVAAGVFVLMVVQAVSFGQSGGTTAPASQPADAVTLAPPPPLTNLERQWSRAWIDAAVGIGKPAALDVECLSQGWGAMHWNESLDARPLCLGGRKFATGLATHADSDIRVRTAGAVKRLHVWAGVDDSDLTRAEQADKVSFAIQAGDKTIWSCPPRAARDGAVEVDVDLAGAREWHLITPSVGGKIRYAHADWCEPVVTMGDDTKVDLALSCSKISLGTPAAPPFSFRYGGKPSAELLPAWQVTRASEAQAGGAPLHRTVWRDPKTQLECVMELQEYADFPAARWVVRFRNAGTADTPILEDIQALDTAWQATSKGRLGFAKGSDSRMDDFLNSSAPLPQRGLEQPPLTFGGRGGRSTVDFLPFFNLQDAQAGVVIAIGWSGQWAAKFEQDFSHNTHVRAGMEKTHLVLHAGEEIRTPSVLVLFWEAEMGTGTATANSVPLRSQSPFPAMRGHNLLRQYILHHVAPRTQDGQIVQAPLSHGNWGGQLSSVQIQDMKRGADAGLAFDVFWIDAGWFGNAGGKFIPESTGYWYGQAGNWDIDKSIHPEGMQDVSKAARAAGMGMMLWVEPERAVWGCRMTKEHPDWYLGERKDGRSVLLNLGLPAARQWVTDKVSTLVKDIGLAWYRQDFNMDCLDQWRGNDAPDRQGMTEIRHIEGLYAFWDELRKRHPNLMIDNCASGGRRIELELLGRSMPLWRSDYQCQGPTADPIGGQVHTAGLSYWIPLHGTSASAGPMDTYAFRSNLSAALQYWAPAEVATSPAVRDWCLAMIRQYKQARPLFYGDYYPLTKTSTQADTWSAIQLHRGDLGQGMLLLLRRAESPFESARFKLGGLVAEASYEFTDADTGKKVTYGGKELMSGTTWTIDTPRTGQLVFYRQVK
jgi:alpha-galactosidase